MYSLAVIKNQCWSLWNTFMFHSLSAVLPLSDTFLWYDNSVKKSNLFSHLSAWDVTHSFGLAEGSITAGKIHFLKVSILNRPLSFDCQFELPSTLLLLLGCLRFLLSFTLQMSRSQFKFCPSCRSCGLLFCSECSEQAVPIPTEQLYQPGENSFPSSDSHHSYNRPIIFQCGSVTAATLTSLVCLFLQGVSDILWPPTGVEISMTKRHSMKKHHVHH